MFGLGHKKKPELLELLDVRQVSRMLRCSPAWIYKAADKGLLPCIKIPSLGQKTKAMVRFKQEDVIDFVERHSHH